MLLVSNRISCGGKRNLICLAMFTLVCLFVLSGCGGSTMAQKTAAYELIDDSIAEDGYKAGIESISTTQESENPLYDTKNAISLYLDRGILLYYAGEYRDSSTSLLQAERLIQEAYTKSVSESVASFILNDNSKEYPGEDFEDIYISVFNALNYYNMGNIDGALVEIRKMTYPSGKLDMLKRKYEELNNKSRSAEGMPEGATLPEPQSAMFENSVLARYLAILFYLADNNEDAARIEQEQLQTAYATQRDIYTHSLPKSLADLTKTTDGKARLDVLCFAGMSPIKREEVVTELFPFFSAQQLHKVNFKLPKLVNRPDRIDRIEIVVNDQTFNLELLEDIGAVIIDTFKARYSSIVTKTYIRTLTKYLALDIANSLLKKDNENTFATIARTATLMAGKAAFDATEHADIRMSRFLPNRVYVGSCFLDPGTYDITINYFSNGELTKTEMLPAYNVAQNNVNLAQLVNLGMTRRIREEGSEVDSERGRSGGRSGGRGGERESSGRRGRNRGNEDTSTE